MNPTEDPDDSANPADLPDDRPIDNVDENAGVSGDAGDINELDIPEGVDD
jgi:hypothetical protein